MNPVSVFERLRRWVPRHPVIHRALGALRAVVDTLRNRSLMTVVFAPPGHFYSPLPSLRDYQHPEPGELTGIVFDLEAQRKLSGRFGSYEPVRWQPNEAFIWDDAVALAGMIGLFGPARIVEIGSGWSSAVILDTSRADLTFIDPYPDLLYSMIGPDDDATVIAEPVQGVPLKVFAALEPDDFLFVDSTHVVKVGSDVHRIIFDILPVLSRGVIVHFHDIFWPFEYPEEWIRAGRAWNEAYLLRALLTDNPTYEILYSSSLVGSGGGSFWLRKSM